MTKPRHSNADDGWINRRFARLEKMIRESNAAKRLQAATIGKGGITVKDGGNIRVPNKDGTEGLVFGPYLLNGGSVPVGLILRMAREGGGDANNILTLYRIGAGEIDGYPDGVTSFTLNADRITAVASGDLLLGGGGNGIIYASTSGLLLSHPTGGVQIDATTTSQASNTYIDAATGRVYRVSSSRRYKRDVVDADVDVDAALALVPRVFRRRDEVDEHGESAPTYIGFIAEEAAELGLDHWVTSDDQGPESFAYSAWPVALQAIVRAQAAQIGDLTARIEALEA